MKEKDLNKKESLMPIYLYMILKNKSSKESPLSRSEIDEILNAEYGVEISSNDRKTIPRHIRTLATYFPNSIVENEAESGGATTWYFNSANAPTLGGNFSIGEVNLLTDMLEESKIISSDCTTALIHKLAASIGDVERKELRIKTYQRGAYKNENQHLLEIKKAVDEAKSNYKQVNITYEIDEKQKELTVMPVEIDETHGKYYLRAYLGSKRYRFYLENIKLITIGKEPTSFVGDYDYDLEDESTKLSQTIALDALFSNTREINHGIKHNKYLTFTCLSYHLEKDNRVKLTPSAPQTVIPINTAYKDGKPYLIAIDTQNGHSPVFYRIDLIKDIKSEGAVDFMEYHKFDAKDSNEYTDKHPFMLSGFTKIRATYLIKADALDRVIDAFGNKATFIGQDKAFESAGGNASKLARAYPELDFSHYLGFDHNETVVKFIVETTDEEAVRFALQNGDVVELESPAPLRGRILDITAKMTARHKKVKR